LAGSATATFSGNELLTSLGWSTVHTHAAWQAGLDTLVLIPQVQGTDFWLARRVQPLSCVQQGCSVFASKSDNLSTASTASSCPSRWRTDGQLSAMWLPLQSAFERSPLRMRNPQVQWASDAQSAYLCGIVEGKAVRAALSATLGAKGLPLPSDAQLTQQVPADVDTDGDGKADAWRAVVRLELAGAQLGGWLP
jgi:hypothetical protein